MKNKSKKDSMLNKKGFYTALYSCVGVAMVLAAGVSFYNINWVSRNEPLPTPRPTQPPPVALDTSELEPASNSTVKSGSYLSPTDNEEIAQRPSIFVEPDLYEELDWDISWRNVPEQPIAQLDVAEATDTGESKAAAAEVPTNDTVAELPDDFNPGLSMFNQDGTMLAQADTLAKPVFNHFTNEDKMDWPVLGEIVMNYSIATGIYDNTLDKYRTNDGICIAAPAGTQVRASADGVVTSVKKTFSDGNVIVIDNGNGWTTTYSQLQDGMLVKEGDIVKAGDVIGGVGSPSIYSVLMGSHLSFKVAKDEQTIDPNAILANQ